MSDQGFLRRGFLTYILTASTTVLFGALLPVLLRSYHRSYGAGGVLVFAQFGGFLCGTLLVPHVARRVGDARVVTVGLMLMALANLGLFTDLPWAVVIVLAVVNGLGFGAVETAVSSSVMGLPEAQRPTTMGTLEVAFGLGAVIMPLVASVAISLLLWRYSFLFVCAGSLIMAVWWHHSHGYEATAAVAATARPKIRASTLPIAVLVRMSAVFFLYVGLETSIVSFIGSVGIARFGLSSALSPFAVTLFWIAMSIGRAACGRLSLRVGYFRFLIASGASAALCLAILSATRVLALSTVLVFALGLCLAGLFAIALVFANYLLPGSSTVTTSILTAAGGLGGGAMPLVIGQLMDHAPIATVFPALCLIALVMTALIGSLRKTRPFQHPVSEGSISITE